MEQFTLEEINFLRWLLEEGLSVTVFHGKVECISRDAILTDHQADLLASIQRKLKGMSSY